ncbi:MAG: NAD(P)H-dependent glycerol-3-phosphate dehydrogenase [Bacillota bacterium]|jgi:glycerol-3-phosphate dehydrogenase (NAD(P)+)
MRIKILGAGSWGTALALVLHNNGHQVSMWNWDALQAEKMMKDHENKAFLPGVPLPQELQVSADFTGLKEAEMVLFVVPSSVTGQVAEQVRGLISPETVLVSCAKGFSPDTQERLSQVIGRVFPDNRICALSGPTHAEEVGRGLPTTIVCAGDDADLLPQVQDVFMNEMFRVYTNSDIIGVEIGGSLKNIIALGAGVIEGLGLGDNAKAALVTRGLVEITRLGEALGAQRETFFGLAGLGDLVVTAGSRHSRNFRAGIRIGEGIPWPQVLEEMGMVVEGVYATENAYKLAAKHQIRMPITQEIHAMLYDNRAPKEAMFNLMTRSKSWEYIK